MREYILEGKISLPNYKGFVKAIGSEYTATADKMFQALWLNYLKNKGSISLTYWSERFHNPRAFNVVLMSLSQGGWIESHSIPARNWAEANLKEDKLLEYVSMQELESIRATNKFAKYRQTATIASNNDTTRINGKRKSTGLIREGFRLAGNVPYQFDTTYLEQYSNVVQLNLTKSMDKIAERLPELKHDRASYGSISVDILDFHLNNPDSTFTSGQRDSDSRGRNIHGHLDKVANPVANKDFRASLKIPSEFC